MSALETFSETGFNTALIQNKQDIKLYLDTAWTVQVIRGVILALSTFAIAPYVAAFYDVPATKPILQVIALSVLLGGFTNIGVICFKKELEFHKLFIYQLSGALADMGVAITAALLLRNVWALVFGLLASAIVGVIVSYIIHPYRPRANFNFHQFKELSGFGRWVWISTILVFLLTHGDDALVGKVLGVTALGLYQLAYRLSNMPATEITHVISQVTFPAYSKLQDNLPRLREAYLKVLQLVAFLSFPIAGLVFVLAGDFTKIFLGGKWIPMVPAMQVLCIFGVTRALNATFGSIFHGMGKPRIITYVAGFQLILLAAIIYPLTSHQRILGTSMAVVLPNFLVLLYLGRKLANTLGYRLTCYFEALFPPTIGCTTMCMVMILVRGRQESNLPGLLLSLLLGTSAYVLTIYVIDTIFKHGLTDSLKQLLKYAYAPAIRKNNPGTD